MEYKVGQWILAKSLTIYHVDSICSCTYCEERGFYEPYVTFYTNDNVDTDVISVYSDVNFEKHVLETSQDEPTDRMYEILEDYKQNQIKQLESQFPCKK